MKKKIIIPLLILLIFILVAMLLDSFNHSHSDQPMQSDTIIILGGGDQGRVQQAARLYESGYADNVIITPVEERYTSEELITILRHYGFAEKDIAVEEESTSTYSNAQKTIEIMDNNNLDSVLVVTSDYHIKRAKIAFNRLNDGSKEFHYIPATNLAGEKWYEREDAYKHWFNEFIKIWGYRLGLYKFFG